MVLMDASVWARGPCSCWMSPVELTALGVELVVLALVVAKTEFAPMEQKEASAC